MDFSLSSNHIVGITKESILIWKLDVKQKEDEEIKIESSRIENALTCIEIKLKLNSQPYLPRYS